MADCINEVVIPGSSPSDQWIDVTVYYDASADDDLSIVTDSAGFALESDPDPVVLTAVQQGEAPFKLKVKRTSKSAAKWCRIEFTFGNTVPKVVEIT